MKNRSLTTAVAMAAILGFGISLTANATSHMMPGKPGGAMMKDGGEKGGKGGKDKMKGTAMMKDGGDKGGKGGKDKMSGKSMMKDGGEKGGKGGKDKLVGPSDSRANMGGATKGSQMRDMGR